MMGTTGFTAMNYFRLRQETLCLIRFAGRTGKDEFNQMR